MTANGVLLVDKPSGMTSHDVCAALKKRFDLNKIGHMGTLDPLASGMLPVAINEAVKYTAYGLEAGKAYRATVRLGVMTATDDADGEVLAEKPVPALTQELVEAALAKYVGDIEQVPPVYCALKYEGKPYYYWARQGREIPRPARRVSIREIHLLGVREHEVDIEVHCGKGTYIRSLARDLGEDLGCGGCISALRRLYVAPFAEEQMVPWAALEALVPGDFTSVLLPIDCLFPQMPQLCVNEQGRQYLYHGRVVCAPAVAGEGETVCLRGPEGDFFGLGRALSPHRYAPLRLLSSFERL